MESSGNGRRVRVPAVPRSCTWLPSARPVRRALLPTPSRRAQYTILGREMRPTCIGNQQEQHHAPPHAEGREAPLARAAARSRPSCDKDARRDGFTDTHPLSQCTHIEVLEYVISSDAQAAKLAVDTSRQSPTSVSVLHDSAGSSSSSSAVAERRVGLATSAKSLS